MTIKLCINEDKFWNGFWYFWPIFLSFLTVTGFVITSYEASTVYDANDDPVWEDYCYDSVFTEYNECSGLVNKAEIKRHLMTALFCMMVVAWSVYGYSKQNKFKISFCNKTGIVRDDGEDKFILREK